MRPATAARVASRPRRRLPLTTGLASRSLGWQPQRGRWRRPEDRGSRRLPAPDVPAAVRRASAGAVGAVAFVAAVASYTHMLDLARHAGEGRLTPLLPISVDGPVVAGSTTIVVRRRNARGGWLAWLAVGSASGIAGRQRCGLP